MPPTIDDVVAELTRLVRACGPFLARLRLRTATGERELLLGARTADLGVATMVDWQTAPLAAVLLAYQEGDDYELEHDDRTLSGQVLRRQLVELRDDEIVAVTWQGRRWTRFADGWRADGHDPPLLLPRPPQLRSPRPIVLDAAQQAAVDLPASRSLLVLGEAGFGKTTVALHRLAALTRQARAERRRFRSLVVVPTAGLERLVLRTLAELGVTGVTVSTFERWVATQAWRVFPALPRRLALASATVARLKRHPALRRVFSKIAAGTAAMREVRAGYHDRPETVRDLLLHLFGDRELLADVVAAADLPASTVAEVVAHTCVQFSPTSERALAHVDADRLRTLDGRPIDAGTPDAGAGTIDPEDFAVVFALHRAITGGAATRHGELSRHEHVIVDEAQELAPIELELIGHAVAPGGSVTVAGDADQQVDASTSFTGWPSVLAELAVREHSEVSLAVGYRCPPAIEALARAVLDPRAPTPAPDPAVVTTRHASRCHLVAALAGSLLAVLVDDPRIRVAVVCRHAETAAALHAQLVRALPVRLVEDGAFTGAPGVDVTCVREIKGLEFDLVIVPDLDLATYPDRPEARRALYVALTRAQHQVWLAGVGPPSPLVA